MKITRDNYEIYFIDYLDGTLPPELIDELKAFLLVNRDLEDQLQSVENCRLPIPSEHFPDKESLKKDIVHECPDYYAIAAAENTLTENDRKTLRMRKDTAVFQALTQTYRKLKLRPDLSIQFEQKARLYRKNTRQLFFRTAGIAAGLLLLLGIGIPLLQNRQHTPAPSYSFVLLQPEDVNFPAMPPVAPAQESGRKTAASLHSKQSPIVEQVKTESKTNLPDRQISSLPVIPPVFARVENDLPENPIELASKHPSTDEIFLTSNARVWKESGEGFLADNIIGSAYATGKNLAEKIKEKIAEKRSNKSIPEYVIE